MELALLSNLFGKVQIRVHKSEFANSYPRAHISLSSSLIRRTPLPNFRKSLLSIVYYELILFIVHYELILSIVYYDSYCLLYIIDSGLL